MNNIRTAYHAVFLALLAFAGTAGIIVAAVKALG